MRKGANAKRATQRRPGRRAGAQGQAAKEQPAEGRERLPEFIPWSVRDSIPPCLPWCPTCGGPLCREPTEAETRTGARGGVWLVAWTLDREYWLERSTCPHCGNALAQSPLGPLRTHEHLRRLAVDRRWQVAEALRCARDPWYWIVNYAVTQDEHWAGKGLEGPYQRFPPMPYLRSLTWLLWHERYPDVPKARQMMLSWLVIGAYAMGEAEFVPGRLTMVQSKKEMDAQNILKRGVGVLRRQAQFAPWMGAKIVEPTSAGRVDLSNGSSVVACPQGAHHVQSYTPARLILDEIQLQDEAEEAYHQALPACETIVKIGSADFGWFWESYLQDNLNR